MLHNWRSRCALVVASLLNLIHSCAFLAAPSLGSKATAVAEAFRADLWRLATSTCGGEVAASRRALDTLNDTGEVPAGAQMVSLGGFVKVALTVATLQVLLTISGLWLAIAPSRGVCCAPLCCSTRRTSMIACCERLRFAQVIFYPVAALALWLLLAAVTMYCITFRWEADELLRRYMDCLDSAAPIGGNSSGDSEASPSYLKSIRTATALCASADMSAIFGLFAACSLIGWRAVLRTSVMIFAAMSTVCGGLMGGIGAFALSSKDELFPQLVSKALINFGTISVLVGLLGLVAAKGERKALLQVYAGLLMLGSIGLAVLCVTLLATSVEALQPWLVSLSTTAAASDTNGATNRESSVAAPMQPTEIIHLLQSHRLSLSALTVVGLFLLMMNCTMAFSLRWIIGANAESSSSGGSLVGRAAYHRVNRYGARVIETVAASSDDEEEALVPRSRAHASSTTTRRGRQPKTSVIVPYMPSSR